MKLKHTKLHMILEVITLLTLIGIYAYLIINWAKIPDQIPGHYNAAGEINRWGNKDELFILPITSTIIYLFITVILFFPSIWNMPVNVTNKNKVKIYGSAKYMMLLLKLEIMIDFFCIMYNQANAQQLPSVFTPVVLIVIFGTVTFFTARIIKASHSK